MLDVAEARALVTTSLTDDDLEEVIAREESWLARRIGPLMGARNEAFTPTDGRESLYLSRATEVVDAIEDANGSHADWQVRPWSNVKLDDEGRSWSGLVSVTYTPTDEDEVRRALITLVRLTLAESAYASQSAGGYSHSIDPEAQRWTRFTAWKSLLRPALPTSLRIRSSVDSGILSRGPAFAVAIGS